jgi:hypothetical protein
LQSAGPLWVSSHPAAIIETSRGRPPGQRIKAGSSGRYAANRCLGREAQGNQKSRPRQLRVLDADTLASFIAVEEPSGRIDGAYAQVVATLRQQQYPLTALQLARNIVADGMEHYSRFTDMQTVLRDYKATERGPPYLLPVTKGDPSDPEVEAALEAYEALKVHLARAYGPGGVGEPQEVAEARLVMGQLEAKAIALAEQRGIGVPFFA